MALMMVLVGSLAVAGAFDSSVVDNRFGTDRRYGSCVLGPCVPHGSAHPSPDSQWPSPNPHPVAPGQRHGAGAPTSGWWPGDPIVGLSQLHCQGSGGQPSYGIFRLGIPTSSMTVEEAHPYRFQASFPEAKLRVSIVPTAHGALYRVASETLKPSEIVLDRKCKIARTNCLNKEGLFTGNWNPHPYACFAAMEADDAAGLVRIAVSFKSQEQAEAYLRDELAGKSFDDLVAAAKAQWDAHLSRIRIEGVDEDEQRRFYSHFMHTFVQPRDRTADGIGWDDHYTLWDTWRTLHPLLMLVDPEAAAGIVNSFGDRFARTGCCETAYTSGKEYKTGQGGDEADVVLADAIVKELPGLEVEKLLPLLESRWNGRTVGYRERGYVAVGEHDDYCRRMKGGSATMSFAWEDWCVGTALTKLGRDGSRFLARSGNWTNVWDETALDEPSGIRGFVRARNEDGSFRPTRPRQGFNSDFYEANCWEYSLFVQQDFEGMVARCGGREAFVKRLEYAHEHDLIDFGNEPGFQAPWLFALAGRPDLTVKWAKKLAEIFPKEACPGDDDSGAMGALYVFLKCGFYPIPVRGLYVLHGSAYPRIVLTLPASGQTLEIVSENLSPENEILEAVYLNGRRLENLVLTHAELLKGGKLTFVWGKAKRAADELKATKLEDYLTPPAEYVSFPREVRFVSRYACAEFDVELYEQANGPHTRQRVMMAIPRGLKGRAPCVVVPFYFPEAMLGFDPATGSRESSLAPAGTNLTYFSTSFMTDLTRRGYITVSADAYHRTYCEPKGEWQDWKRAGEALMRDWPNWTGVGKLTFDTRLLVDFAVADNRVDADRIGMIGHSLGGKMAYYAGLTDSRVKAIVASDFGLGWTQTNWEDVWYWGAKLPTVRAQGYSNADLYVHSGFKPLCVIAGEYDDADTALILRGVTPPEKLDCVKVIRHGTGHPPPVWAKAESYQFLDRHLRQ